MKKSEIVVVWKFHSEFLKYFQFTFLVKWRGYSPSHNEWRPVNALDCPQILAEYFNSKIQKDDMERSVASNLLVNVSDNLNAFQENLLRKLEDLENKEHATQPVQPTSNPSTAAGQSISPMSDVPPTMLTELSLPQHLPAHQRAEKFSSVLRAKLHSNVTRS